MADRSASDTVEINLTPPPSSIERPIPFSSLVKVEVSGLSHPGKVRSNNEDHFLLLRYDRSLRTLGTNLPAGAAPDHFDESGYGLVVADGMGGHAAGEVASSLALTLGLNLSLNNPRWTLKITEAEAHYLMELLRHRIQQLDAVLAARARADPALRGMGTTLTGAFSIGADLFVCNVGDSRVYRFRNGRLTRLTRDQTLAQAMVDAGQLDPAEVDTHRLRHVLTQAVGIQGGSVEAEIAHGLLADGDRLLVCTDGLTEMVPDAEIAAVLGSVAGSEDACRVLVERALEHGGKDNVTVVVARYTLPEIPTAPP